jgi:hypothetical protein
MDVDQLEALAQADAEEEAQQKEKRPRMKKISPIPYEDDLELKT